MRDLLIDCASFALLNLLYSKFFTRLGNLILYRAYILSRFKRKSIRSCYYRTVQQHTRIDSQGGSSER